MSRIVFARQLRKNIRPSGASAIPLHARPKAWICALGLGGALCAAVALPGKLDAMWSVFTPAKAYSLPKEASLAAPATLSIDPPIKNQPQEISAQPVQVSASQVAEKAVQKTIAKAIDKGMNPKLMAKASKADRLDERDRKVAQYLAKNYRIANEAAALIVAEANKAAKINNVDPLLILAVIGVESRYNPLAESSAGAKGLTQTLPRAHPEKIARLGAGGHILNIADNIQMGSAALGEYLKRFKGNEVLALQQYNGSLKDQSRGYSARVLSLRAKIARACA